MIPCFNVSNLWFWMGDRQKGFSDKENLKIKLFAHKQLMNLKKCSDPVHRPTDKAAFLCPQGQRTGSFILFLSSSLLYLHVRHVNSPL